MSKRFDTLLLKEEWTEQEFLEFSDLLCNGVDKRPIPSKSIGNIYRTLKEFYPGGICADFHGTSDAAGWEYVAHEAATLLTGDHYRIDSCGGYPSDFYIDSYRKGRIFIATEGYKGQPSLEIYSIDNAIEKLVTDEWFLESLKDERIMFLDEDKKND